MILVIDNYDSFTYNIVQYFYKLGREVIVNRNDQICISEIEQMAPDFIVLSPGPGTPSTAGITLDVIHAFKGRIPILGVCLGHQAIGQAFGAKVVPGQSPVHGKISRIVNDQKTIYQGLPPSFDVTRYHSLIIERDSLPDCLEVSGQTQDGTIMSIRHKEYAIEGVQFHPEAILTNYGFDLFRNFLHYYSTVKESQ